MPEIVISEFMDPAAVDDLAKNHEVVYDPELVDRPEALAEAVADARGLIVRNRTQVRGELLEAAPRLKVVGRLGVGLDNIDLEACGSRGIEVCPALGANDLAVAEYTVGTAMVLLRGAYQSQDEMTAGNWPRNRLMGRETAGKALGLIGFGAIARETARLAGALGMQVGAHDRFVADTDPAWAGVRRFDIDDLLGWADVISLHVPLNETTRHMIDAHTLAKMKPGSILINAARGGVVDETALAAALASGHLAGAAIDVFEAEPLTQAAATPFRGLSNVILTPHIAGVTQESNTRVSWATAANVSRVLAAAS